MDNNTIGIKIIKCLYWKKNFMNGDIKTNMNEITPTSNTILSCCLISLKFLIK